MEANQYSNSPNLCVTKFNELLVISTMDNRYPHAYGRKQWHIYNISKVAIWTHVDRLYGDLHELSNEYHTN